MSHPIRLKGLPLDLASFASDAVRESGEAPQEGRKLSASGVEALLHRYHRLDYRIADNDSAPFVRTRRRSCPEFVRLGDLLEAALRSFQTG